MSALYDRTPRAPAAPRSSRDDARDVFERRGSPRVAASLRVQLYCSGLPGPLEATTRDVGSGGVCVETPSPFDLSAVRRAVIDMPDASLTCKLEGCWQRPALGRGGILSGLRFVELEPEARGRVWRFVHTRAVELSEFLRDRARLGELDLDAGLDLALTTRVVEFSAGTWIYRQGAEDPAQCSAFVVYNGRVGLVASSRAGREVFLGRAEAGEIFGGLPLVSQLPQPESAVAEQNVVLLEIDSAAWGYLARMKPETAAQLARALVARQVTHLEGLIERCSSSPA